MFKVFFIALLIVGSVVLPAKAEDTAASPDETSAVLSRLEAKLRRHPDLAAYASRVEASGNYAQGELGLPDPMLFVEQRQYSFDFDATRRFGDRMVGFRQEIPRASVREARSGRLQVESRKNRLLQDYAFASLKAKMLTAFADLKKVKELHAIAREQDKLLQTQRQSLQGSVAANRVGPAGLHRRGDRRVVVGRRFLHCHDGGVRNAHRHRRAQRHHDDRPLLASDGA